MSARLRGLIAAAGVVLAATQAAVLPVAGEEVKVAVAANFSAVAEELASEFKAKTGNDVTLSSGATGALYTQITQGAPFEVFLSADNRRPAESIREGFGVEGTSFTYAVGRLVLFSRTNALDNGAEVLRAGEFSHVAIADPATAPYGTAAVETMAALGLMDALRPKLVTGVNITQTLQFVDSGNAELGFVALSQVIRRAEGHQWLVPTDLYAPIVQDAVLLGPGAESAAARAFLDFLKSEQGRSIIETYGYGTGD
jgi:molybdate transport system substrate-binding protein